MAADYDVLVAGAGLVGATFAACLASTPNIGALRIAVVDRDAVAALPAGGLFDARVVALTEASRSVLEDAGIWSDELASQACPYTHMAVRDREGTGFIEFDCATVHRANLGHIVENSLVVAAARERLEGLSNVVFIPQGIRAVDRPSGGLAAELELDGGERIRASLLVAADGANSLVREQCGFKMRSWDYGQSAIVATIRTERPHQSTAYQWFTPSGPLAFLPLRVHADESRYSSIVWSQDHGEAKRLMALSDGAFCAALTEVSEARLGAVDVVEKRYSFPLRQRHAIDYIQPGIALLGDAAHTIHPLAGQGVNLGFADARTLVEEISEGLQRGLHPGHEAVLQRYQRRRKPDNLAMMVAMEGFKRLFSSNDPLFRVLRNVGMSGLNGLSQAKSSLIRKAMGF